MAIRDELYRQFGPCLLEAMVDFILDNVNILRKEQGMPEYTKEEYETLLMNHVSEIPPYDWMSGT